MSDLQQRIEALWERRDELSPDDLDATATVHEAIDQLDTGAARVAEMVDGEVVVHQWLKLAILLLFKQSKMATIELGPFEFADKIPLKTSLRLRLYSPQPRWYIRRVRLRRTPSL